jgi:hypothetical protein
LWNGNKQPEYRDGERRYNQQSAPEKNNGQRP